MIFLTTFMQHSTYKYTHFIALPGETQVAAIYFCFLLQSYKPSHKQRIKSQTKECARKKKKCQTREYKHTKSIIRVQIVVNTNETILFFVVISSSRDKQKITTNKCLGKQILIYTV